LFLALYMVVEVPTNGKCVANSYTFTVTTLIRDLPAALFDCLAELLIYKGRGIKCLVRAPDFKFLD
jgi:hypothetical protein